MTDVKKEGERFESQRKTGFAKMVGKRIPGPDLRDIGGKQTDRGRGKQQIKRCLRGRERKGRREA